MRIYLFLLLCCLCFVSLFFDHCADAAPPPTLFVKKVDYNVNGQAARVEYGNGIVTTQTYDTKTFRLKRIYTVKGAVVLQDLNYTYDALGNVLSIVDAKNSGDQTFAYDHLNRLKQATSQAYGPKTYSYDTIGNIKTKEGIAFSYSGINAGPHAVTSLGDGSAMSYDPNGNMSVMSQTGSNHAYTFDVENRLVNVKKNGSTVAQYSYDGDGGRVRKIGFNGTTSTTTRYVGPLFEETGGVGVNHVFWGATKILTVSNNQSRFYFYDHLGSANVVTDSSGNPIELIEYKPFGEFARHEKYGGNENVAWQYFTSKPLDEETGLMFYGARYYAPFLGKFITPDTIVPSGSNPQSLNRYSYVYNNPVNLTDPTGNFPWMAAIIGAIIGGTTSAIQSYQVTGKINWTGVAINAIIGGFSGATLAPSTTASSLQITAFPKTSMLLLKSSAALSLGSQVTGAAGWSNLSQSLGTGAQYLGYGFLGLQVGVGIANWIHDPRFQTVRLDGGAGGIQSGDKVHVNGMLTPLDKTAGFANNALDEARYVGAEVLAYNPTSSPIADLVEATFSKMFFTGSIERQLSGSLAGLSGIGLSGFSQGGIIASNTALGLGLTDQRNVLKALTVNSTQVSQIRVGISGAIGGGLRFANKSLTYGTGSWLDFSNALGPNLRPNYFIGGVLGLTVLPVGISHHYLP